LRPFDGLSHDRILKVMEAVIQIRGGKTCAVDSSGTVLQTVKEHNFLAGDRVLVKDGIVQFVYRKKTYAIGIVCAFFHSDVILKYPHYPNFQTNSYRSDGLQIGDRAIVLLESTGVATIIRYFSDAPSQDLALIMELYHHNAAAPFQGGTIGVNHYTKPFEDLTHFDTFTVDPECSIDLDDAISLDPIKQILYVHIVDIASSITAGSTLDEVMFRHGSTLYLAEENRHLLPNDVVDTLSLNAGMPRRAITVEMKIGTHGDVESYEIYPSMILVKRRLNYDELEALKSLEPYNMLLSFTNKNPLPLDIPSLLLDVDGDGKLIGTRHLYSNDDSHRMVSCAMIAANFAVSAHLEKLGIKMPNRFHNAPSGIVSTEVEAITHNSIVDSFIAVKKWRPAVYDLHKKGHFGLGLTSYVHFTSPMRRYPDVIIHRLLAGVIYDKDWLDVAIEFMNDRLMFVKNLQKYYNSVKLRRFLTSNNESLTVYVTNVSRAGISWYDPKYLLNGFCHVANIDKGVFWHFNGAALTSDKSTITVVSKLQSSEIKYDYGTLSYKISLATL
jgi:exoribonuclease R